MSISLDHLLNLALLEDAVDRDITGLATVPEYARCQVRLVAKQDGVLSGMQAFLRTFELCDTFLEDIESSQDGHAFSRGDVLARFSGQTRGVLAAERTALNILQHLSGIATLTAAFVKAVEGTDAKICDTRKTMPLLRALAKDAVRHGGGANHRFNLGDGVLIKDNHLTAAGSVAEAISRARKNTHHLLKVEVEVSTLAQFQEALDAGADVVMLDNMTLETMREAVGLAKDSGVVLEASGNMTLERVRDVAQTGVHFISVGALTHSAPAADVSLLIENA